MIKKYFFMVIILIIFYDIYKILNNNYLSQIKNEYKNISIINNTILNTDNIMNSINKRSKMCDADANGKVGSACKR